MCFFVCKYIIINCIVETYIVLYNVMLCFVMLYYIIWYFTRRGHQCLPSGGTFAQRDEHFIVTDQHGRGQEGSRLLPQVRCLSQTDQVKQAELIINCLYHTEISSSQTLRAVVGSNRGRMRRFSLITALTTELTHYICFSFAFWHCCIYCC